MGGKQACCQKKGSVLKDLLNILKSEFLKLKKDTMFYTGTIISILMPILVILKDEFLSSPPDNLMDWVMTCCLVDFLILSVLSGFIITNSVQKEYQSGALKNILSAAVSRASFLFAKLAVWFVWYVLLLIYMEFVAVIGSSLLYPSQFDFEFAKTIMILFTKFGLLAFLSFVPLLWVTIRQRKLYYPAILVTIGFTGVLLGGVSISMEMILPASMIPWTAVSLVALYQVQSPYRVISIVSILLTGTIGLILALREIYKQDQ